MSRPLRVALAVEGATDEVVLKAAVESMVGDRPIQFTLLQPEFSLAFALRKADRSRAVPS